MLDIEREAAVALGTSLQDLQSSIDNFRSDAVAADGRDTISAHGVLLSVGGKALVGGGN